MFANSIHLKNFGSTNAFDYVDFQTDSKYNPEMIGRSMLQESKESNRKTGLISLTRKLFSWSMLKLRLRGLNGEAGINIYTLLYIK